ncbi:HNH endonuclease-domain-containing protein [Lipomyces doorenjongii]
MAADRSLGRDVHFYDSSSPDKVLAHPYEVYLRGIDTPLRPTDEPLQPGNYDIKSNSPQDNRIFITNEWCITRILSQTVSGRDEVFQQRVRERDRKCVITGVVNPDRLIALNDWSSYHAAHIFPLSGEEWFIRNNYSRWIANREGTHDTGINSCQNGLLMLSHIHEKFDNFSIAINPDDNYRIISFRDDIFNVGGRLLDPVCRNPSNENCVRDELLQWHFRQAVLANMRGAGEPVFETDFPPGSDMVGEIRNGPDAIKRMEAEFFARLGGLSLA